MGSCDWGETVGDAGRCWVKGGGGAVGALLPDRVARLHEGWEVVSLSLTYPDVQALWHLLSHIKICKRNW